MLYDKTMQNLNNKASGVVELTPENVTQMIDWLKNIIETIKTNIPIVDRQKYHSYINESNIHIIEEVAEYASEHPQTVTPLIDVQEWMQTLETLHAVYAIKNVEEQLQIVLSDFVNSEEIIAYQDFQKYYKCMKMLVAANLPEAVAIYPTMKQIYANYFGKKGARTCPVTEIKSAMSLANNVLMKHKGVIHELLNDEAKLKDNLQHEIHDEENIANEN